MSDDDDDNNGTGKQPRKSAKPKTPARDDRGRWLPGASPNPKGRPRKRRISYDPSDIHWFANTQIEISANGKVETMDRRTALVNKMYESAMKGRVSMQRFLYKEMQHTDKQLAIASTRYWDLMNEWFLDNSDWKERGIDPPHAILMEMDRLYGILHHYHGDSYPLDRPSTHETDVDDNEDE